MNWAGDQNGRVVIAQIMQPHEANPMGNIHGGVIMKYIDNAAAVIATRHARGTAVTASIDRLDFFYPVSVGDLLLLKANLNWVGHTSMEIEVRVEAEHLADGTIRHIASSYLTFVALDEEGHPRQVPALELVDEQMQRRFREALARRKIRLAEKKREEECQRHGRCEL